ncbi:hypothetical protein FRC04_010735 [Tulasnella sp. 424]|nr:hypothetical protein FRC04_010735 [Tulasnella sp. 424]
MCSALTIHSRRRTTIRVGLPVQAITERPLPLVKAGHTTLLRLRLWKSKLKNLIISYKRIKLPALALPIAVLTNLNLLQSTGIPSLLAPGDHHHQALPPPTPLSEGPYRNTRNQSNDCRAGNPDGRLRPTPDGRISEQVLADPEWAAVRATYLLSQRLRKGAFKRPPPREGKGKERALSFAETSDESEEEVVNYVLGEMGTEPGMEDFEGDDLYVPTDGEGRMKAPKGRKGKRPQERGGVPETIEEISAWDGWPDEPGATRRHLSMAMESVEGRAPSPEVTALPSKLHTALVRRGSQSAEYIPIKRPRKRKRRFNTSESEEKLADDDLSSASEWADDSGSAAKPERGEVPPDSLLLVSRNGKRMHSIWTARGTQRNMRIFTEEEQLRIEAECTIRWCHMCHKKKLIMACNASKGRCAAAFCDHCLARYPLDFDPFTTFSCPKCEGTCICGACMQNRAKREANLAAGGAKPRRKAAPRTKLSKADRAEQTRLFGASNNLPSDAELSDASSEDVPMAKIVSRTQTAGRRTASTLSSPSPPSPPPQLLDQFINTASIRWSTPLSYRASSPDIPSSGFGENAPTPTPLTPPHPSTWADDYPYLRSKGLPSSPARSSSSSLGAASYFEKQLQLVEAKDSVEKLKKERRKAIPVVSPFEMTSEQVFEWAEPFRKEEPVQQPLHQVRRRYGFLGLDPGVTLPGQTWVGDVGMFAFDEEEVSASTPPPPLSDQTQAMDVGVSLGQLELDQPPRPKVTPKSLDPIVIPSIATESSSRILISDSDTKDPADLSASESHTRVASGSTEPCDEMTPSVATSTIVADEADDGFAYCMEKLDTHIKFLNGTSGPPGDLDDPKSMDVDTTGGDVNKMLLKVPGSFVLLSSV